VKNKQLLCSVKQERKILHKEHEGRLTGLVASCVQICLVKHYTEKRIREEGSGKQERRCPQLLDDLTEREDTGI
jgi:hypothetical protein